MAYVKTEGFTRIPNFLESAEGLVLKTADFPQSLGTADGAFKIVKAGTAYPADNATATGIVYQCEDVTHGPAVGSVLVCGRVITERVNVSSEAKTALEALGIVFVDAKETTVPFPVED